MAKILVVDDSETLRGQLKTSLEASGYSVVEGQDGLHGIEVLNANPDVKLIFSDVNMPNMDGLTMCEKIHADAKFASIPIFMLTTESNADLKTRGKAAGVVAWITKPFVADKVVEGVKKVVK
jgi:two-component system chemotaxis response regulator CheY